MYMFNKKIITIMVTFTLFSGSAISQTANEFDCSPEEMAEILDTSRSPDRNKQTTFSQFQAPYQQATLVERTGKQPDQLSAEDYKDNSDLSCLNVDMSKINIDIFGGLDKLSKMITDGFGSVVDAMGDVMDDLSKGLCSRAAVAVGGFVTDKADEYGSIAKRSAEKKLRQQEIYKILSPSKRNYLINEKINDTFNDEYNLLNWRNGGVDENHFKNKSGKLFGKEVDGVYDDFDDNIDDYLGID
jgi:hypothetical protein